MSVSRRVAMIAAVLVYAGTAQRASAAQWVEVGSATNGIKLLVDTDSPVAEKTRVQLEQRFVFPRTGSHRLSRVDQLVVYACASRTVTTLRSIEYERGGRISRVDPAESIPPYRIAPGTLPQFVFDLVC